MEKQNNVIFLGDRLMRKDTKKQANYQDKFEELYLRYDYLRRVKDYNTDLMLYENIVKSTALISYEKYRMTFNKVGFSYDDIVNITRVYLHGFLGVYSFEVNPESLEKFKVNFMESKGREPNADDIINKQRNIIINFLRQRLQACSIFCERKSRNIVGSRGHKVYFAYTSKTIPASNDMIVESHRDLGYRELTEQEYSQAKKISKSKKLKHIEDSKGFKIVEIDIYSHAPLNLFWSATDDFSLEEIHHSMISPSAENVVIEMEEEVEFLANKEIFNKMNKKDLKGKLREFIQSNKENNGLKKEIMLARKMLKTSNFVV
jgi:hypothetical protein